MADSVSLPRDPDYFLDHLAGLQRDIRDRVHARLLGDPLAALSEASEPNEGDTVFSIDVDADEVLDGFFRAWGDELPLALIAEGIPGDGWRTYPVGTPRNEVRFACVVDPIDGTRGLMYDKRSAWVLAGIAPVIDGRVPTLADIRIAMQTEIPTSRSALSDVLWTVDGEEAAAQTHNLDTGAVRTRRLQPSGAPDLRYGFGTVCKFFPGGKAVAARIEETMVERLLGEQAGGNPLLFDDEYISSGGQLFELMAGHDRFVADLRPVIQAALGFAGQTAHPYDLCTESIARAAGVIVTDTNGAALAYPLDVRVACGWIGYANGSLRDGVEPVLRDAMRDVIGEQ